MCYAIIFYPRYVTLIDTEARSHLYNILNLLKKSCVMNVSFVSTRWFLNTNTSSFFTYKIIDCRYNIVRGITHQTAIAVQYTRLTDWVFFYDGSTEIGNAPVASRKHIHMYYIYLFLGINISALIDEAVFISRNTLIVR